MKRVVRITAASLVLAVSVVAAPVVGARSVKADDAQRGNATVQTVQNKAAENKLRVCEQKQASLQKRLDKIAAQGEKQLAVFEKISNLIQDFKSKKGLTVENYEQLVAAVGTAHDDAAAAMHKASTAPKVDCKTDDPKAALTAYQNAVKARNTEMKKYKAAVKELLLAVKKSQNQAGTSTETEADKTDTEKTESTPVTANGTTTTTTTDTTGGQQ